jgi:hypothetical protein
VVVFCKVAGFVCLRQAQTGAYDLIGCRTAATASTASVTTAADEIERTRARRVQRSLKVMPLKLHFHAVETQCTDEDAVDILVAYHVQRCMRVGPVAMAATPRRLRRGSR